MPTGTPTNRTNVDLPTEVSQDIIKKTQEQSAVMQLARRVPLPGRGVTIPVIVSDPEASWVGEAERKPVSNPALDKKTLRAYKLAVIVPFSDEFRRDAKILYDELISRLPLALASKFDKTAFGNVTAPGTDFDTFENCTAQDIDADAYAGLVAADMDVSLHGGIVNGYVIAPQGKGILLSARDGDQRPLFINSVAEGAIPMILGARTLVAKAAYKAASGGDPQVVGVMGDWTKAIYGTVEGVKVRFSEEATLDAGNGNTINLFQDNMNAVRAEIEIGFRCDTTVFNRLTA